MGAPRWPPYPPPLGPPRHSRVAPRRSLLHERPPPWGPRDRPHTPHRSARPGTAGSPLVDRCFTRGLLHGGPEIAPIPPTARHAPPHPARPPSLAPPRAPPSTGAPTSPPCPPPLAPPRPARLR